jgi:serine/threonine-protein kinase
MEAMMELDDLKQAWQTIDRRLEQNSALQLHMYRDGKLDVMRRGLRPLAWSQVLQILFGALVVALSVSFWSAYWQETPMLVTGILMQAYGIVTIAMGGITLARIGRMDYAAPVLGMQKQLAEVRKQHVLGGMIVGLPWWVLWLPVLVMVFRAAFGADLYSNLQTWFWLNVGVGVVGVLACWGLHRWSQQPGRPRLAKLVDDALTGKSLSKAQGVLDEIAQFERE